MVNFTSSSFPLLYNVCRLAQLHDDFCIQHVDSNVAATDSFQEVRQMTHYVPVIHVIWIVDDVNRWLLHIDSGFLVVSFAIIFSIEYYSKKCIVLIWTIEINRWTFVSLLEQCGQDINGENKTRKSFAYFMVVISHTGEVL